jgi:putative ABC transport system substrate-binding protein
MRRRDFITLFGGTAATWSLAARAQQSAKMRRIAFVNPAAEVSEMNVSGRPYCRAFFEELARLGYVEGQNLRVDRYSGGGRIEGYAELVRDVVNTHPDLILTIGVRLSLDFKMATTTIPVVTVVFDPIALGLVASIARLGGNVTGVTIAGGFEIIGKRMGLLVEAMPKLSTLGFLASRPFWKIQEVRQRERRPKGRELRCRLLCWAPLLTRQSTSASSGRWNKIEWIRSWYLMNPSTAPIVR